MSTSFSDRLADAVQTKSSVLVVGLDPRLDRFPTSILEAAERDGGSAREIAARAMTSFHREVIDAVADTACAVKPQIAFFEQWGPPGLAAYEDAIDAAHDAGLLVIGDVKRGDIGSTAAAYADAHLTGAHAADSITVNPYLGTDSIEPFLAKVRDEMAGLFVLVRTSNPSARELQDLACGDRVLHEAVADLVTRWGREHLGACGYSSVGAVVGATAPTELARLRDRLGQAWLLLPGVGAQGATPADVAAAFDERGLGAVVNSSRGILYPFEDRADPAWKDAVRGAAVSLRDALREVTSGASAG